MYWLFYLTQLDDCNIVQVKIAIANTEPIDIVLAMVFGLVDGEVDFCLNIAS